MGEHGGQPRTIDVETVSDGGADLLGQARLGESLLQGPGRPPRRIKLIVDRAHRKGVVFIRVCEQLREALRMDLADRCQVAPLIGKRVEFVVEKLRVAVLARISLKWEGDEVAEATRRQHVLAWEQTVVRLDPDRCTAGHRTCKDRVNAWCWQAPQRTLGLAQTPGLHSFAHRGE